MINKKFEIFFQLGIVRRTGKRLVQIMLEIQIMLIIIQIMLEIQIILQINSNT